MNSLGGEFSRGLVLPLHTRVARAGAAVAALWGLASCASVAEDQQLPEPALSVEAAPSAAADTYEPTGICNTVDLASSEPSTRQGAAQYCMDAMDNGRIAMVVTGNPDNFELLAAGIERVVDQASQGVVDVDIDVMGTPMEVAGAFSRAMGDEDCVGTQDLDEQGEPYYTDRRLLSTIAGQEMAEELSEYHGVIGVTEFGVCEDASIQGMAELGGRYADLFNVDAFADAGQVAYDVVVGAHEIFHLYALRHSGEVMHSDGFFPQPGVPFDLQTHVQEAVYHEYTAGNRLDVMGLAGENLRVSLNAVHLDNLARLRSVVEGETPLLSQQVDSQGGMFTENDALAHRFARVGLSEPLTLTRKVGDQEIGRDFDTVAVVPLADEDGLYSAHLYLTNAAGYTVSIGGVPAGDQLQAEQTYTFEVGGDTLIIQSGPDGLRVRKAVTQAATVHVD